MSNLALGKLPLEKEKWIRPKEATDGNFSKYTGSIGFAASQWPCSYTIDLGVENKISLIRFLLWDNLGGESNLPDSRKYKFSLEISSDGYNYINIFSNEDTSGSNGWFIFKFSNPTFARFVKLRGTRNTANDEFHIVEFEVHDEPIENPQSSNIQIFEIVARIQSEARIQEIIEKKLAERSQLLIGLEDKIKALDSNLTKSNEGLEQIDLIRESIDFSTESTNNNTRARHWLFASAATLIIFIVLLVLFLYCDTQSKKIIINSYDNDKLKPYTKILLGAFYVTKAILLSTVLYVLSWILKNYRSEKHNYVINKQKAMTLTVATGILTKEEYKNTERGQIFNEAMKIVFTHQPSGFSKEETNSPSIAHSLIEKEIFNKP